MTTQESLSASVLWIMQAYRYRWFGFTSGPTEFEYRLVAHHRVGLVPQRDLCRWAIDRRRGRWSR